MPGEPGRKRMRLVVAGAGIVGSACAYVASSLGAQVTLIDSGQPGQATAAGAGIICPWTAGIDDPAGYAFACAAARASPALVAELAAVGGAGYLLPPGRGASPPAWPSAWIPASTWRRSTPALAPQGR